MNERLHENIHLTIYLKDFKDHKDHKSDHGECIAYYDGATARLFDININNKLRHRTLLETLAHEFVHLKQYAKNEWYQYDRSDTMHRFRGEIFELDIEKADDYWLAPWEIEAYGSEYGLFRSFFIANKEFYKKYPKLKR